MISTPRVSVVIPCYNEEKSIGAVVDEVKMYADEIIVVDNNSTDATAHIARERHARVVSEKVAGYGTALRRGFAEARGEIVVTIDGDGQYPGEKIGELVHLLVNKKLDFINTSRFPLQDKKSMPLVRRFGNSVLTFLVDILFGLRLRDSQSGMWIFRRSIVSFLALTSSGMSLSEEIKIRAFSNPRIRCAEFPIPYYERAGESTSGQFSNSVGQASLARA